MDDENSFQDLIAELPNWNNGEGVGSDAWIEMMGNYELAIGYSLVFWPRFVVIDGYVLRAGATAEALRQWEQATGGDRRAIEASMNHFHIADLHVNASKPNEAQLRYIGRVLQETHRAKLAANFPERRFVVQFSDEPGLDNLDYELTFWQEG